MTQGASVSQVLVPAAGSTGFRSQVTNGMPARTNGSAVPNCVSPLIGSLRDGSLRLSTVVPESFGGR